MKTTLAVFAVLLSCFTAAAQTINRAEYFFNADPGVGNGIPLPVTAAASVNQTFNVSIASLGTGFHSVNTRVRSSNRIWSHFVSRTFYIVPPPALLPPATQIRRAEFFFDDDPGVGLATPTPVPQTNPVTFNISVPVNTLTPGFHNVNVRVQDNRGRWTLFTQRTFYIIPPVTGTTATTVVRAEYFIDRDPGPGSATRLAITSGSSLNNTFTIDVTGVTPGFHRIGVRVQDNRGRWSLFADRLFFILQPVAPGVTIRRLEYFIDNDPEQNSSLNGTGLAITAAATINGNFSIDLAGVAPGNHVLYVRAQDDKGRWSTVRQASFSILNCTPPAAPTAPAVGRCKEGTVTLAASGATGSQVYRWYEDNTTTTVLATGASFTTPALTATRTYFVSVYDPATTCESPRTQVAANINFTAKPVVNPSGEASFCEGGSVVLSAPAGFTQYLWSNGETTRQILVTAAGTFTVQVGDGNCTSPASDPVNVIVIAGAPKPEITVTGNTTICGTGTVNLTGPDGFQYLWSNGATTRTITVSQSGVYFLRVRSGTCQSLPSEPVVVTVQTPPCGAVIDNDPPVINNTPLASTIEGVATLDLTTIISDPDGNVDFGSLRLASDVTARGATASIDAGYNLQIDYSGLPFTGTDRITLEVCDLAGACVQQVIDIEVVGAVVVYNGVTPDGDGKNDFLLLKYVDVVEGAQENKVMVLNRWGDVVYETTNYNNTDRVFDGRTNSGGDLPSGTYFYKVEFNSGLPTLTGYITLMR